MSDPRATLAALTRDLGRPERDLVILGEGNTSIGVDDGTFLVKASGFSFVDASEEHFVAVRRAPVLGLLERDAVGEDELVACYRDAKVDADDPRRPSVETVMHAALLALPGIEVVAHTHPIAINSLSCATSWPEGFRGRLFPDETVVCGPETVLVDYVDPGVELARAIVAAVDRHRARRDGAVPKMIVMQNHGLIALGASATEAVNVTAMAVKAARIRLGALAAGGIRPLGDAITEHLLNRPDEKYRIALLGKEGRDA